MPPTAMNPASDRNLLFGVLAVQLDYVDSTQLVQAANQWMLDKSKTLGEILIEQGALRAEDREFIETIVARQIARSGSAEESLRKLRDAGSGASEISKATEFVSHLVGPELKAVDPEVRAPTNLTISWDSVPKNSASERFDLLRELARGGLGEVFVARDLELDREVALKKILDEKANSNEVQQRFVAEAKITGGLEHPGVVPVYGLGRLDDGRPYYAMRLIRGRSLQEALDQLHSSDHKLPPREFEREFRSLTRSIIQACYAIGYAHSRGVLHRDIKPQNIMLGKYGETLVVDWGLAKVTGEREINLVLSEPPIDEVRSGDSEPTRLGTVLGTPGFMSPEQAQGRLDAMDRRSDVFSLGATLYALLTGKQPYQGKLRFEVLRAAQNHDFQAPRRVDPRISKSLEAICLKAMAEQPHERYASAVELAEDLDAWIAGAPVAAYPESLIMRGFRFARRHQTAVASLLVLLLASSVSLVWANRAISHQRDAARSARDKADIARGQAEQERVKAEKASQVAMHNSDVSIRILNEFVKNLADDKWANVPQFETERLQMVDLALLQFKELLGESPDNVKLKRSVCEVLTRSANILRNGGKLDDASQRMEEAFKIAQELQANDSADVSLLSLITDCLLYLTEAHLATSGPKLAWNSANQLLTTCRTRQTYDKRSGAKLSLAMALVSRAEIGYQLGKFEDSLSDVQESLAIFDKLQLPKDQTFLKPLMMASARVTAAAVLRRRHQLEESLQQASNTVAALESEMKNYPGDANFPNFLAGAEMAAAETLLDMNRIDDARSSIDSAIARMQRLQKDFPENATFRSQLARAHLARGQALVFGRSFGEALESVDRAKSLLPSESGAVDAQTLPLRVLEAALRHGCLKELGRSDDAEKSSQELNDLTDRLQALNDADPVLVTIRSLQP